MRQRIRRGGMGGRALGQQKGKGDGMACARGLEVEGMEMRAPGDQK